MFGTRREDIDNPVLEGVEWLIARVPDAVRQYLPERKQVIYFLRVTWPAVAYKIAIALLITGFFVGTRAHASRRWGQANRFWRTYISGGGEGQRGGGGHHGRTVHGDIAEEAHKINKKENQKKTKTKK